MLTACSRARLCKDFRAATVSTYRVEFVAEMAGFSSAISAGSAHLGEEVKPAAAVEPVLVFSALISASPRLRVKFTACLVPAMPG